METVGALIFITCLIFVAALLLVLGSYYYAQNRREHSTLIDRIKASGEDQERQPSEDSLRTAANRLITFIRSLGSLAKPKDETELSHLKKTFLRAGIRNEKASMTFFGAKVFLGILFPALFSMVKMTILGPIPSIFSLLILFVLAVIGFYLPGIWLRMRVNKRKERMTEGLPEALDMMVVCVEAGMGLDAAINRVGEEIAMSNEVVGEEFRLLSLELKVGKQRKDALRSLAMRTDLEDVNSLVTLLVQTEKFGTSIGQSLRVHSDSMRVKRQQRAEEIAAKLPVKLLFPLIVFIFPALFVVILGPAVIRFIRILLPVINSV
jgi:tight adherence protein C